MSRPLSPGQRRLWFVEQVGGSRSAYLTPCTYELTGQVDVAALERALRHVVTRHEVLRSTVDVVGGDPVAVVRPPDSVRLLRFDVSVSADPDEDARQVVSRLLAGPNPLETGPVLRAAVIDLGGSRTLFHYHVHHIAFDGMSRPVFERELSTAYAVFASGGDLTPPEPCLWHGDRGPDEEDSAQLLEFWRDLLTDVPSVLELPSERARPEQFDIRAGQVEAVIPEDVVADAEILAREQHSSLFGVAAAVYLAVLGRWTGTVRPVAGTPFAGRLDEDLGDAVGFFTATVVLPADLRARPSLRTLSAQLRDTVLDLLDHQDVPFESLVGASGTERRLDRAPLVQHWFDLAAGALLEPALELTGASVRPVEHPEETTRFDTELHLVPTGAGLAARLVYATALFDEETMRRFVEHYVRLFTEAVRQPDTALAALASAGPDELRELRRLGDGGPGHDPSTVDEMVAAVVAAHPDAVAVSESGRTCTYRELQERADRLAAALRANGVGPEQVVGVHLPRGRDLVVAMLGVVRAGAAYLPLDPALPRERVVRLLRDVRASLIVADPSESFGIPVLPVEQNDFAPLVADRVNRPDSLLYVVHTSGSTGVPKGVAVAHGTFTNLLDWHLRRHAGGPGTTTAQTASISFDAAAWEIWAALASGSRLEICSDDLVRDPDRLVEHFAAEEVTTAFLPTAVAEQVIRHPLRDRGRLAGLLTGGDVFRPRRHDDPGVPVVNHYGPTENSVVATAGPDLRAPWDTVTIGRPIDGVRAYVLDDSLSLVPRGVAGELCLGGRGVARGYFDRGAPTAERFVPDPFAAEPGARMYRTGDLVRWHSDGSLRFLGRIDAQIKISGYRIEPGEIEAALLRLPEVRDALVVAAGTLPVLTAYVEAGDSADADALRAALGQVLPAYLVPSAFVLFDVFPRTVSGKVDRAALPAPAVAGAAPVAPRGPLEEVVHGMWGEVLPDSEFGVESDFFVVGGSSLDAGRLATRIAERFGVGFGVRAVFDLRTVAAQCVEIERAIAVEIASMSEEEIAAVVRGN